MEPVEENIGYVTVQQAANMVGVHRGSIYQAIESGRLIPVKVLGQLVLRCADVQAYHPRTYRDRRRASYLGQNRDGSAESARYDLPAEPLQRYHSLLDRKFSGGLNANEELELQRVGAELDAADLATPLEARGVNTAAAVHEQRLRTLDDVILHLKSLVE